MIENLDPHERSRRGEAPGEGQVLPGRLGVAGGVVVEQHEGGGPGDDGLLEDLPRMHQARGETPHGHHRLAPQTVPGVEGEQMAVSRQAVSDMLRAVREMPEVEAVAVSTNTPYSSSMWANGTRIDGKEVHFLWTLTSPDLQRVLRLQLLHGRWVDEAGVTTGLAVIQVVGSTGGITTIEYESGALADLERSIELLAPSEGDYAHNARWGDGNGFSHVRSALLKTSLALPIVGGRLQLGTWQQIVVLNFDNRPREREVVGVICGA